MVIPFYLRFQSLFDELQQNGQCCGAESPLDYNSTWWFEVSNKYVDEYESLVNDTDRTEVDYITKTPVKALTYSYASIPNSNHTHLRSHFQRWDEEKNITTNTFMLQEEENRGIN